MADAGFKNSGLKDGFKSKGPALLDDLAAQCTLALQERGGLDEEKASQVGREVADRMAAHWGGQLVYFPMGFSYRLSQRDRQIYNDFTGSNHSELARKYGVSLQWIYKIVKTVRQEETARNQGRLFK